MKKTIIAVFIAAIFLFQGITPALATQGCCSHHGGVCGCSGGRQSCCDGSLSPSCTCAYVPLVVKTTPKPTAQPILKPTTKSTATPTPKPTEKTTPMPSQKPQEATPTPAAILPATTESTENSGSPAGGLGVLALLGAGGFWLYRRFKKKPQ